jgi:hypothetical protein
MPRSGLYARRARGSVLFIERDRDLRDVYLDIGEMFGFTAYGAVTIQEGLTLARALRPDVVVCHVPRGTAFGRALRAAVPGSCLVAVTSESRLEQRADECAGFDWILRKVFGLDEYETMLVRAMETAQMRKQAV